MTNTCKLCQILWSRTNREEIGKGKMEEGQAAPPWPRHGGPHGPWWLPRSDLGRPFPASFLVFFAVFRITAVWTITQCDFSNKRMFLGHERGSILIILSSIHILIGARIILKQEMVKLKVRSCKDSMPNLQSTDSSTITDEHFSSFSCLFSF